MERGWPAPCASGLFRYISKVAARTLHRFTVDDYYRMADTGVIPPGARVELIEGQIVDMMPIGPFHSGTVNRLTRLLTRLSRGRWLVSVQNPIRLSEHSEPQPDLALLRPVDDDYTSRHPGAEDVFWLVEVADSTLEFDRTEKLPIYARAGIPEIWLLNLMEEALEIFREPAFTGYASHLVLRPGDEVRPSAFPDTALNVSELLRRAR